PSGVREGGAVHPGPPAGDVSLRRTTPLALRARSAVGVRVGPSSTRVPGRVCAVCCVLVPLMPPADGAARPPGSLCCCAPSSSLTAALGDDDRAVGRESPEGERPRPPEARHDHPRRRPPRPASQRRRHRPDPVLGRGGGEEDGGVGGRPGRDALVRRRQSEPGGRAAPSAGGTEGESRDDVAGGAGGRA
ncbi:hypothetical protein THAOC_37416, partial [Thalassiosira oceanica]